MGQEQDPCQPVPAKDPNEIENREQEILHEGPKLLWGIDFVRAQEASVVLATIGFRSNEILDFSPGKVSISSRREAPGP